MPIFYKRNLDSNIECCTIMLTEPTTPLIFMRNPVGLFICGLFYVSVSKTIINNRQQMQPSFDKILSLSKEILISEQARDRILSKLMSGELKVLE